MDQRFDEGLTLFNRGEFFEAHEVWEDLWHEFRGDDRTFLQGLIQAAAGFYHHQCGNPRGASSQLGKALAKLGPYAPVHRGIAVGALMEDLEAWRERVAEREPGRPYPRLTRTSAPPSN